MMWLALVLSGTVLADGVPCQRLLTDAGRRVWVQGLPQDIDRGDHVTLQGEWRHSLTCQARVFRITGIIEPGAPAPKHEVLP